MHQERIISEFTRQARAFDVAPVMRSSETLQTLLDLIPASSEQRWIEVACGTGLITRALAPRVRSVVGVDLTPAMLDLARHEATKAGLHNAEFVVGDATSLAFDDACFDGAVTRFSLHHIPVADRGVAEMARVVRRGGWIVIGDHVTSDDPDVAAWHQEIERLRDPSHWSSFTPARLRALGARHGLVLQTERLIPFVLDFEEWLTRGTGGVQMRLVIERALSLRPDGDPVFRVEPDETGRLWLHLVYWLSLWRR